MRREIVLAVAILAVIGVVLTGCQSSGGGSSSSSEKASSSSSSASAGAVVYRVSCASEADYKDQAGNVWSADKVLGEGGSTWGAIGGSIVDRGEITIPGTKAPGVYRTERWGLEAYQFKVDNGKYTVRLHFAETYWGITSEGMRIFTVKLQGKTVLRDFDPYKEAGFQKPVVKEFKGIAVSDGKLRVDFEPYIQEPEINGIEVVKE